MLPGHHHTCTVSSTLAHAGKLWHIRGAIKAQPWAANEVAGDPSGARNRTEILRKRMVAASRDIRKAVSGSEEAASQRHGCVFPLDAAAVDFIRSDRPYLPVQYSKRTWSERTGARPSMRTVAFPPLDEGL